MKVIYNNVASWKFLDNLKRVSPISLPKEALEILASYQCGLWHPDLLNNAGRGNKRAEWNMDVRVAADIPSEYNEHSNHNMQACEQPSTKQILNTTVHYIWNRHLILILDDIDPLAERILRWNAPPVVYRCHLHNSESFEHFNKVCAEASFLQPVVQAFNIYSISVFSKQWR